MRSCMRAMTLPARLWRGGSVGSSRTRRATGFALRAAQTLPAAGIAFLAVCLASSPAGAGELIPTPDFSDYKIPISVLPAGDHPFWDWFNVGLLVLGLALASYLALVRRSRRGLFLLGITALVWFGFVRAGCVCPIGATQNVSLALCDRNYAIPITVVALFMLPLVFTLFFGRTFCAAVCPLGAIQELVAVRPVRVPSWLEHGLGLIPFIYLGLAVIYAATNTAWVICRYDPFVAMFRLSGNVNMLIFGGSLLLLGVFVGRPYCRFLCPYGALLGLVSRGSKWHAKIPPSQCIQCRLCEDSCPYGAIQTPTPAVSPKSLPTARRRLVLALALAPVLVAAGGLLGGLLAVPLSRLDPVDRLAERIHLEDAGLVEGTTDASEAFRNTGQPPEELHSQAWQIRGRFGRLGLLLGGWVGLVIGGKLISLAIRRKRTDFQPDRSRCVSCGRCYWYCPGEQVRLGNIREVSELVDMEMLERTREQAMAAPPAERPSAQGRAELEATAR